MRSDNQIIIKKTLNLFFILFITIGGLVSGLTSAFYRTEIQSIIDEIKHQETLTVTLQNKIVAEQFKNIFSNLLFLSRQNELKCHIASNSWREHLMVKVAQKTASSLGTPEPASTASDQNALIIPIAHHFLPTHFNASKLYSARFQVLPDVLPFAAGEIIHDAYLGPTFQQGIGQGNSINNIAQIYPSAVTVEYHFEGFEEEYAGLDWRSLRLVFEASGGTWYLVGIVHDEWTI